ncbi:MAG TPA: TonB-dependent receptor, partial [Blastocatellia bacterium]
MIRNLLAFLVISVTIWSGSVRSLTANAEPAQATTGTVQGQVTDSSGAAVVGASVTLSNSITNYKVTTKTDDTGAFRFQNVPFNSYKLTVSAPEFQQNEQTIDLHSAVPTQVNVQLAVKALSAEVSVSAGESHVIEPDRTSADTDLNTPMLVKQLGAAPSRGLQKMVESAPGVVEDDNQRIHARGSESGVLTVINGVPVSENLSAIFATSIDPRTASHVEVLTGGIPAEFGDKLGAVVNVNTKSGLDMPISGEITGNIGSFVTGDAAATFGGHVQKFGWFTAFSGSTTHRYLDPPAIENFHNIGRSASNFTTLDYNPTSNDFLKLTLMFGGANFQVPNRLSQEVSGQDQRQQQRNYSQTLSWQHLFTPTIVGNFSVFHRASTANL